MEHLTITNTQLAVSGLVALALVVAGIIVAEMRNR
jgi:hypothetical protein